VSRCDIASTAAAAKVFGATLVEIETLDTIMVTLNFDELAASAPWVCLALSLSSALPFPLSHSSTISAFLSSPSREQIQTENPHIELAYQKTNGRHPLLVAEYTNGSSMPISLRNLNPEGSPFFLPSDRFVFGGIIFIYFI